MPSNKLEVSLVYDHHIGPTVSVETFLHRHGQGPHIERASLAVYGYSSVRAT